MIKTHIFSDSNELSRGYASWLVALVKKTLQTQDRFTIALSGGSTPKKLFGLLASDEFRQQIEWPKLHFFWGDERFVAFSDERNNAAMSFTELLDRVPVNKEQIHIMDTSLAPAEAVEDYEKILKRYFENSGKTFDLVMLGLGDNAHTLSLFPGYPVIHEKKAWVSAFFLKEQDMYRITLTAPVTNRAAFITYLVAGADKAEAVYEVIEGPRDFDLYPAQVIKPESGELHWFLDKAAAGRLTNNKI